MKTKTVWAVIFLVAVLSFAEKIYAAQWTLCASVPSGGRLYYDKNSVKKMDKNIMRVSNKFEYTSKTDKQRAHASLKRIKKAPKNPDMMSHDLSVSEINCATGTHRLISVAFYDVKGRVIYSSAKFDKRWGKIVADSFMDELRKTICGDCRECKTKKK